MGPSAMGLLPHCSPRNRAPVVRNLNGIKLEFACSIDTVGGRGIKKTVLLRTSDKSRALRTPTKVNGCDGGGTNTRAIQ